ncbi:MAG: DNA translocase FtsK 4TM domain-containing protein, partial [Muribaculaceae bacterium]|nr:DNA translocase FtsK 4TM domain-containing protein [Muribaculaceae bacterium]
MTDRFNRPESLDDYDLGMGGAPARPAPRVRKNEKKVRERTLHSTAREPEQRKRTATTTKRPAPAARKPRKPSYGLKDFLADYRTHLAFGLCLCVLAVVMTGVSISFFFNGQLDQSITHGRTISEVVASGQEVGNAGGAVGARLARFLMVDTLGIGSFIIALYIFLIGLWAMRVIRINFITLTFKSLYSAIAISLILGLLTFHSDGFFHLGGNHGYYINDMIQRFAGGLGAYAVAVILLGGLVAIYLHPITTFMLAAMRTFHGVRSHIPDRKSSQPAAPDSVDPEESEALSPVSLTSLDETDDAASHPQLSGEAAEDDDDDDDDDDEPDDNRSSDPTEEPEDEGKVERFDTPDIDILEEEPQKNDEIPFTVRIPQVPAADPASPPLSITNLATEDDDEHTLPEDNEIADGAHLGLETIYD